MTSVASISELVRGLLEAKILPHASSKPVILA